jgi:hypothetical protein
VVLSKARVQRGLVLLTQDEFGAARMDRVEATIALCRGLKCGGRWRVLPCDVLAHKTFNLSAIESLAARYAKGDRSLRAVVGSTLGERTPAHTTLHGWTEGIGAHVLGRPPRATSRVPFTRLLAESEKHVPALAGVDRRPEVDPRRYRSDARHDRLQAMAFVLAAALVVTCVVGPGSLTAWRRLAVTWLAASALGFGSRISCTSFEQVDLFDRQRCAPQREERAEKCRVRTRSPPSGSSRSRR